MSKRNYRQNNRRSNYRRGGQRSKGQGSSVRVEQLIKKANPVIEETQSVSKSFADFNLPDPIFRAIQDQGFTHPTPIQAESIPVVLSKRDVVGVAHTGTGKTASFLIPLLSLFHQNPEQKVLVIAPTRELAVQINQEMKTLSKFMRASSVLVIGGISMHRQIEALRRDFAFVIGTPGRIKDLADRRKLDFSHFSTVVLDEVDRMLDMGFIKDVSEMMQKLPTQRHSLFFSATMSAEIQRLVQSFSQDPEVISLKNQATSHNVDQDIIRVSGGDKRQLLEELLKKESVTKVIIFGRTKRGVNKLSTQLERSGHSVAAIHGNKSQPQRQRALQAFAKNRVNILVATDVAARGIDIPDVSHVINYDIPATYDDYIHRIGRTGRAGKKGFALTFI